MHLFMLYVAFSLEIGIEIPWDFLSPDVTAF